MDTSKLSENGSSRIYVKMGTKFETRNSFEKGMIGPITSKNVRYLFVVSNGTYEVGQFDLGSGQLLDTTNYGPENTRDAQMIVTRFLSN